MSEQNLGKLEAAANAVLFEEKDPPTPDQIRVVIGQLRPVFGIDEGAAEQLAKKFEAQHDVSMEIGASLTTDDYEPWLNHAKAELNFFYWNRYRQLLVEKAYSKKVVASMDEVTDRILDLMGDPTRPGPWDRRGMVVGHVQSGKTANYTGLICKAADAGYKVIIVIAGIHNNLRNQTQLRIEEGFVGVERVVGDKGSGKAFATRRVGVGRFNATRQPATFTTSTRDFNKQTAEAVGIPIRDLKEPVVFVIKKNLSTLKNLLAWLGDHDEPMVLIDDEADNASINIKRDKDDVSKINEHIRLLLRKSSKSCYVGYTATPFANIFIDPDTDDEMLGSDLFPEDFIVSLDPPSDYFGPDVVFREKPDEIIREIADNEELLPIKHKIDHDLVDLPPSMLDALRTFLVARTIRVLRGDGKQHCSMLVNASRFVGIQSDIRNLLHDQLEQIKSSVSTYAALPETQACRDPEIAALREAWLAEYKDSGDGWSTVQSRLSEAIAPISVVTVNAKSPGNLNYEANKTNGLQVIAVGGLSLSRGLTLEGLTVSYFLRNSVMYDTLMQMGRWFGYRPKYRDLCRVWMPDEAQGWYSHIAESIEMLRSELRMMEASQRPPREFGLKVRSHPDSLLITARNKIGSGQEIVHEVGLANNFVETVMLARTQFAANRDAVRSFSESLDRAGHSASSASRSVSGLLFESVDVDLVLSFLNGWRNTPESVFTDPEPVTKYIEDRASGEHALWDVLVRGSEKLGDRLVDNTFGVPLGCMRRSFDEKTPGIVRVSGAKQRVGDARDERSGLAEPVAVTAEAEFRAASPHAKTFPGLIYREVRERPLLVIYPLFLAGRDNTLPPDEQPAMAWGISFPRTKLEEQTVKFVVNAVWMKERYGDDDLDEEDWDSDD